MLHDNKEVSRIEIANEVINRQSVYAKSINNETINKIIGYMIITNFNKKTAIEFKEELSGLIEEKIDFLIIDLRDNPGGLIEFSIQICEQILPEDKVIYNIHSRDDKITKRTINPDFIDLPIYVLVNKNTASAAEVLSGALKDNKAATIIGERTFGKGLLQEIVTFDDGTGYTLSIAEYSTPNGTFINHNGIEPDIIIDKENILDEIIKLNIK